MQHDPISKFSEWFEQAKACAAIIDATSMVLSTATERGIPAARVVLLKEHGPGGFVFYGNMGSRKFIELKANPHAALCIHWAPLDKQVRIEGTVQQVSDAEADAYFASRNRGSQIGAWASKQTEPLTSRGELLDRIEAIGKQYDGKDVPRPPHWSGFRLTPSAIELWHQVEFRLHERDYYERISPTAPWQHTLLYP